MNRARCKELLPIMQAFAEGKEIEWEHSSNVWHNSNEYKPVWSDGVEYRIKPEPFECWVIFDENRVPLAIDESKDKLNTNLSLTTTVRMREVE